MKLDISIYKKLIYACNKYHFINIEEIKDTVRIEEVNEDTPTHIKYYF